MLQGCSPQSLLVRHAADALSAQGVAPEDDLLLARDAAPFFLKTAESVLRQNPGHLKLAETVAAGFTQYAYAFVAFDSEQLQTQDARAAQVLRARASALYARGFAHAAVALDLLRPGLSSPADRSPMPAEAVPLAYWAAAALAARVATSKDAEVVAELPRAMALALSAYATAPDHGNGALASLLGSLEAGRPGGSTVQARAYFERAMAAGSNARPGVRVAMAEALALPAGDRAAFETLLRDALAQPLLPGDLDAQVIQRRARWLLDRSDDLF